MPNQYRNGKRRRDNGGRWSCRGWSRASVSSGSKGGLSGLGVGQGGGHGLQMFFLQKTVARDCSYRQKEDVGPLREREREQADQTCATTGAKSIDGGSEGGFQRVSVEREREKERGRDDDM